MHIQMHTHMHLYNQITTNRNSPASNTHNHKNAFQGDDGEFDAQLTSVERKLELIGHHMNRTKEAKSKYEAMLA